MFIKQKKSVSYQTKIKLISSWHSVQIKDDYILLVRVFSAEPRSVMKEDVLPLERAAVHRLRR